jgi:hypothetical protein
MLRHVGANFHGDSCGISATCVPPFFIVRLIPRYG